MQKMNRISFRRAMVCIAIMMALFLSAVSVDARKVNVRAYTRKDGTYVRAHTRNSPGSGSSYRSRSSRNYGGSYSSTPSSSGTMGSYDSGSSVSSGSEVSPYASTASTQPAQSFDANAVAMDSESTTSTTGDAGTLPDTGGEPLLMSLMGLTVAFGSLAVRRRIR